MGFPDADLPEHCLLNACYAICILRVMVSVTLLSKLCQHGGMVRIWGQDICDHHDDMARQVWAFQLDVIRLDNGTASIRSPSY